MPGSPIVSTLEHYERFAEEIEDPACPKVRDPVDDAPRVAAWMAQADGPEFFQALGDVRGQALLEIGIGTGRVARKVLGLGCERLVGLDISPKTLARARRTLGAPANLELVCESIETFRRPQAFDAAYAVWTFFHVEDKPRALANVVASLKPGGRLVLSLERTEECLDYGSRRVRQFPVPAGRHVTWLQELGCRVDPPVEVVETVFFPGDTHSPELFTVILRAVKL